MTHIYSPHEYECPHCFYRGLMYFGDNRIYLGINWLFYICPGCNRWVATNGKEGLIKIFDLPFLPLGLNRPII